MMPQSVPFHTYIEPARACSAWWRVLIGLVIIVGTWFTTGLGLVALAASGALVPVGIGPQVTLALSGEDRTMPPEGVMFFLLTFLGLWIGLWIAVRLVHRRSFGTLFHPSGRPDGRNLLRGVALALGFYAVSMVAYFAVMGAPERSALPFSDWAIWVVPIVFAIMMQASSEELLMRGYMLQHFAIWSRHPLVWALIPSLIFMILHYDPGMQPGIRTRMLVHILIFALIAAALVWRTGGLGAAMGLHIANNIMAIGGIGIEGSALGFELWLFPANTLERMFAFDLALGALMLAGVFILFKPERRS